jgi:hypothetical protein
MVYTCSGQSGTPGANIPPTDPTTTNVNQTKGSADANDPNNANNPYDTTLIGTPMARTTMMATGKVHTLVIAKIILLCGFPDNSTMVRYINQHGLVRAGRC